MTARTAASAEGVHPPDDAHPSPQAMSEVPVEPLTAQERRLHRLTAVACLVVALGWFAGYWFAVMRPGVGRGWIVVLEFAALGGAASTIQLDLGLRGWAARTAVACGLLTAALGVFFGLRIVLTGADLGYAGVPGFVISLFAVWATVVSWQARSRARWSESVTFLGRVVGAACIGAVVLDLPGTPQWLATAAHVTSFTGTLLLPIWFAWLGAAHLTSPHPQRRVGQPDDVGAAPTPAPAARAGPALPPPRPVTPTTRDGHYVSPDGVWWWDGSDWRPVQAARQRQLRYVPIVILTAILTAASVLLGLFAPYAASMGAIGLADLRISGGGSSYFLTHSSDFLTMQALLLTGAILGVLAMTLRPRHLLPKLLAAVGIGFSIAGAVLFSLFYWG